MDQEAKKKYNKPETGGKTGIYVHPDVPGEEVPADNFPQADAFLRQGWVYKGPLPSRLEVAERDKKALEQQIADAKNSEGNAQLDTLKNEVAAAKAEEQKFGPQVVNTAPAEPVEITRPEEGVPSAPITKDTPKELQPEDSQPTENLKGAKTGKESK